MLYKIINRKQFSVTEGFHPMDSIIIVLNGKFDCTISGKSYTVEQGDIFVFNKNSRFSRSVLLEFSAVYLQFDSFPHKLEDGLFKVQDALRAQNTIAHLNKAVLKQDDVLVNHFVNDLFIIHGVSSEATRRFSDPVVSECADYMRCNFDKKIKLNALAQRFNISEQWLIKRFTNTVGETPIKFLNSLRIDKAKQLLIDTDLYIGEISELCGFENPYYFSTAFKKANGICPAEYRNKFRV